MKRALGTWAASLMLSISMVGCSSIDVTVPPEPVMTPNLKAVQALNYTVDGQSINIKAATDRYSVCVAPTKRWEEVEPGRVQFSCEYPDGTIVQLEWFVLPNSAPTFENFTFTSMNDAEFAAMTVTGQQAQDALQLLLENQPMF